MSSAQDDPRRPVPTFGLDAALERADALGLAVDAEAMPGVARNLDLLAHHHAIVRAAAARAGDEAR